MSIGIAVVGLIIAGFFFFVNSTLSIILAIIFITFAIIVEVYETIKRNELKTKEEAEKLEKKKQEQRKIELLEKLLEEKEQGKKDI